MQHITIYHNPQCSKSRKALEILQSQTLHLEVVDYLKTPLSLTQLKNLTQEIPLSELVRTEDKGFKALNIPLENTQQILEALQKEPLFMQRPIVSNNQHTLIARPPERVWELLESSSTPNS